MRSGWEEKKLGEFMDFKNGINADKEAYGSGVKFVNVMDIFKKTFLDKDDIIGAVEISDKQADDYSVIKGDILFNRTSETPEEIAFSAVYVGEERITFGGFVIRGRQTQNLLSPDFAGYCFKSNRVRKELISQCQGVVRANIGQKDLNEISILIPPLPEQRKIAGILHTWDEAVEKLKKILELKRKVRTSLIARIISSQTPNIPLKHFITNVARPVPKPLEPYSSLGLRSHCKGTFQRFVENFNKVEMDTLYQVKANDLIVNITFAWEGAVAIVKPEDEHCLVSHRFPTYEIDLKKAYPDFVRYIIQTRRFTELMGIISPGGAGRNRVLNKKDFLEQKVWLPDLETQKFIGDLLCKAEEDINVTSKLLDTYKSQGRGLMQKLLTGAWRVTPSKEAA